ncbi:hypothetical protein [Neisseria bergeri]|uniref:hypothetical protein n=1 Tax=Neisseria bergeri TaxID=1906581 RepID=UPI00272AF47C|nr:hypothetical protein [Neisseria bergeri]
MRNIVEFKELMQHEIPECPVVLTSEGYKLDGQHGIKSALRILDRNGGTPKSCDYLQPYKDTLLLVEFSDLAAQHRRCGATLETLNLTVLSRSERNRVEDRLGAEEEIKNELRDKIRDTDFILREVNSRQMLEGLPDLQVCRFHIFIVWHPLDNPLEKYDTARLLDGLRLKLDADISRCLLGYFTDVPIHFLTVEAYEARYGVSAVGSNPQTDILITAADD